MSTRAIAPVVGVSDRQVRYDVESGGNRLPTSPTEIEPTERSEVITGMDGKTYTRPEPVEPP